MKISDAKITLAAALLAAALAFTGCSKAPAESPQGQLPSEEGEALSIVTTIFPEYDWVREILGENPAGAQVEMLSGSGADMHGYQPGVSDIARIGACDVFVYVGGESDEWAEDVLREAANPDMRVVNLLEVLGSGAKEEEAAEGMQTEEHEHEHGHEHEGAEEAEGPEYDEHVWLSLRSASVCCDAIASAISEADPGNASVYEANCEAYKQKLAALDAEYARTAGSAARGVLLFADRFPFRYMTDDYGLDYYAAFAGCSAETEASFETVIFLAAKADELQLPCVMIIDGSDGKIAQTVVENTAAKDARILVLDSMQSVTLADAASGKTYLGIMKDNLGVLGEAIN